LEIKKSFLGIFGKVFLYTVLILLVVIGGMFLFFSNQIRSAVTITQQRQTTDVFAPIVSQLEGKSHDEIIAFVTEFHEENRSLHFRFETDDGEVLFETPGFQMPDNRGNIEPGRFVMRGNTLGNMPNFTTRNTNGDQTLYLSMLGDGFVLYIASSFTGETVYGEIVRTAIIFFGLTLLIGLIAAFLFARRIAKPIQKVSADTRAMSKLLPVAKPRDRADEIGQLAGDVYVMYDRLKDTIHQLEIEIERVKTMEENQRYFFSAASHELKTPIAAAGAIFEGMLSDVITLDEYPQYLREGMKLIKEQNKLVSEILELVKLNGQLPAQETERLNLRNCIDGVLEPLAPLIEARTQTLAINVAEDMLCKLNSRLFSKVLSNILLNATQNSPHGAEIHIIAQEEREHTCLRVWNSDASIPNHIMPKLCEPFYRADEARTSSEGRSGLGLTIVKKAMDLMEIDFEIKNQNGGVLFQMHIPIE